MRIRPSRNVATGTRCVSTLFTRMACARDGLVIARADSLFERRCGGIASRKGRGQSRGRKRRRKIVSLARARARARARTRTSVAPIKIILIGNTYCLRIMPSSHGRNIDWPRNLYVAYDLFRVRAPWLLESEILSKWHSRKMQIRTIRECLLRIKTAGSEVPLYHHNAGYIEFRSDCSF